MTNDDSARAHGLFAATVGRPVALSVAFLTLLVVGAIAYQRIPLQLLPSGFTQPEVNVWIPNPGASAHENEEEVAKVVEDELETLTGIEELRSWSDQDSVFMRIEFSGTADMDLAKAEVRDRIERARPLLPGTVEQIGTWTESASSVPVTFFGILLKGDLETRDRLVERVIVPRLEAVPGIGKVTVWGVLRDSVRILLDEDRVAAARLDIGQLVRRLGQDNFALPLGEVNDGGREIILRSDMRFRTPEEVAEVPIGGGLRIRDVGRVERVKSVGDSLSIIDGGVAYYGMAVKDSQSNVVEVSRAWERALADLEHDPALEGRMSSMTFFLQGEMIESALEQLRSTAMWGGVLAVVVLFLFLRRVRLTLCVALSIPVSALLAIAWEYFTGGTFNVLTMTGLTLGIGMLVDNAIVVVENVARLHQLGRSAREAAVVGTRQIALAMTLATLTTVVVFLPLIFMSSNPMVRVLFGGIVIPFSISLLASLLVATTFLPVVTARCLGLRPRAVQALARGVAPLARGPVRAIAWCLGGLRALWFGVLRGAWALERTLLRGLAPLRWLVALAAVALLVWRLRSRHGYDVGAGLSDFGVALGGGPEQARRDGSFQALGTLLAVGLATFGLPIWRRMVERAPVRPAHFVPRGDSLIDMVVAGNRRLVAWTLDHRFGAVGLSLLALLTAFVPLSLMDFAPFGEDSRVDRVEFNVLFNTSFRLEEADQEVARYGEFLEERRERYGFDHWSCRFDETDASFALYWDERREREFFDDLQVELQRELPRVPGHTLVFYDGESTSARSADVASFTLVGPESSELERLAVQGQRVLASVPGLSQVSSQRQNAPEQIDVRVDRDLASDLGVDSEAIQQTIAWTLRGFPLPSFQEKGRQVPLLIEYDEEQTAGLSTLRDLSVFGKDGMVPLSSVAQLGFSKGSRSIMRRNGQTSLTLTAKVDDPTQIVPVTERGYRALAELEMPRGYGFDRSDSARSRQQEEFGELLWALLLAVTLVFLLMGVLFESLLLPFSVLFTIPFALLGAIWTLFLRSTPLDVMGLMGMILLAGVVVNNGIVLVDRVHGLRREGMQRAEAVALGCAQRVRPILMTAMTTVCGLVPMILAEPTGGDGIDYRALAAIVAGGLASSTFFTLWVVPLAYCVLDDLAARVRAELGWWLGRLSRGRRARPGPGASEPTPAA